ncbi:MAG: hypothetical protein AB8I08_12800 [Sandaracinaceae bacterium]
MNALLLALASLLLSPTAHAQERSPALALSQPTSGQRAVPYSSEPLSEEWLGLDAGLASHAYDWTIVGIVATALGLGAGGSLLAVAGAQPDLRLDVTGGGSNLGGYLVMAAVPTLVLGLVVTCLSFGVRFRTNRRRAALRKEMAPR